MIDWKVGDKAVCIRNDWDINSRGERPIVGNIYTVQRVFVGNRVGCGREEVGLRFLEAVPVSYLGGYPAADFRKVAKDEAESKKSICNKLDELFDQKADA